MVRRHGWQLPAHTFQVVAITVFFLLAIAFYVFFAPFLGSDALQYAAIAVYSPVAFAVLLLYIRCSAIDPSDPGIFVDQGEKPFHKHTKGVMYAESSPAMTLPGQGVPQSPGLDTPARSSSVARFDKEINAKLSYMEAGQTGWPTRHTAQRERCFFCCGIFGFLCGWIVKADNCKREVEKEPQMGDEDVLFCTLCNAEVRKFSKHCRSCDKCVDGFDHHCRWLNNCVGRKNYITFISLMASSLTLLVLEWGIGIAVLVRCFIDKRGTESQIVDKLGNSFSRAPFAAVVALCTLVPLLASLPLGELFFFHILLIRKGITTYEYVVAMRAQSEHQGHEEQSIPSSPSSSTATGLSASSSVGLPYRGAWCTPPRIFVEHQDEIIPHLGSGRVPSTVDPDSVLAMAKHDSKSHKRPVRISAWRLAKLNPDEAARAALKARENSSILRPIGAQSLKGTETDYSSSSNISTRSSVSNDYGLMNNSKRRARDILLSKSITPPPRQSTDDLCLPFEQRIRSTYSSPNYSVNGSGVMSPVPEEQNSSPPSSFHTTNSRLRPASLGTAFTSHRASLPPLPQQAPAEYLNWVSNTPASDGYEASGGESGDDVPRPIRFLASGKVEEHGFNETMRGSNYSHLMQLQKARNSLSTSDAPVIVGMKQVWAENSPSPSPSSISDASIAHGYANERPIQEQTPQDGSSISKPLSQSTENLSYAGSKSTENLQYSGTSIFYGGPISFLESNGRTDSTAHLPLHASNPLVLKTMADFPQKPSQDCKLLLQRAALARSQSPVFVPRNLSANASQLS